MFKKDFNAPGLWGRGLQKKNHKYCSYWELQLLMTQHNFTSARQCLISGVPPLHRALSAGKGAKRWSFWRLCFLLAWRLGWWARTHSLFWHKGHYEPYACSIVYVKYWPLSIHVLPKLPCRRMAYWQKKEKRNLLVGETHHLLLPNGNKSRSRSPIQV